MLQLQLRARKEYLQADLIGLVSVEAWEGGLRQLEAAIDAAPGDRLVVNLTGLVGWLGVPERSRVGALMATHLRRMKKVALYIEAGKVASMAVAEARRPGLDLRVFPRYDDAVHWAIS